MNPTEITLIPGGTIQFWDTEFNVVNENESDKKVKTRFDYARFDYEENISSSARDERRANSNHRDRGESSEFKLVGFQKVSSGTEDGTEQWINVVDGKPYFNSDDSEQHEGLEPSVSIDK
ncbi:MAG: hypothetical protein FJ184_10160, partial [Gammaproteobacteria bacterium]|nr:hypothetical protein [Gammaproteobacteria bacterium]